MKLTDKLYFYTERAMLDSNTYVITGKPNVIIDPGSPESLPAKIGDMSRDGLKPEDIGLILNTHLHGDHCWANDQLRELSGAKTLCHPLQKEYWTQTVIDTARVFGLNPIEFTVDGLLEDARLDCGDTRWELIPSPGHSLDSICFYSAEAKALICGDVVFDQNTGRVDLPGGNADQLKQSIEHLATLSIEHLLPGHMGTVSGAEQVRRNFELIRSQVFPWL